MRLFGLEIITPWGRKEERGVHPATGASSDFDPLGSALAEALGLKGFSGAKSGVSVSVDTALGAATVFACVRVLANTLASLPLEVIRTEGAGAGVPARDHPVSYLLTTAPNPYMTIGNVIGAAEVWLALSGKAFVEVVRDSDLDPVGLYPIPNGRMAVTVADGAVSYTLDNAPISRSRVLHFRGLSFDGINSIHTTAKTRESIALALALQDNAAMFFGNGSRMSAVLEHPGNLSEQAQLRLKAAIESQSTGKNAYRTVILEEGMKLNFNRSENKDSQFIESRDRQDLEICRVFGVPPHKVGIMSGQPRANVEQDNLSFIADTIKPICVAFEQELNRVLFSPEDIAAGYSVRFNLDDLQRGDMPSRYNAYAVARQGGWLSVNDIRQRERLPSIEGGNTYLTPLNMADASKPADATPPKQEPANAKTN
jgi:HK97 family phage portal protein